MKVGERIKASYSEASLIGSLLNEIKELSSPYTTSPIEFSKESFLKHIDFEDLDPEIVFEYIDWKNNYINDDVTDIGINYWKDDSYGFGWKYDKTENYTHLGPGNSKINLRIRHRRSQHAYRIFLQISISQTGKLKLNFDVGIDIPEPKLVKSEFQLHWWSPVYINRYNRMPRGTRMP